MPEAELSDVDRTLLRLLQENARATNRELAKAAGIAESTCLERVRSLRQRGIILGWHAEVDPAVLGRDIRALVSVRLQPKTTASVRAFQKAVLAANETLSISTVAGADDFVIEVAVSTVDALREFVLENVTSRHDVADTRTALVYEYERKRVVDVPPST